MTAEPERSEQDRAREARSDWIEYYSDDVFRDRQDTKDGAALRRLREALPGGAWYELSTPADGDVEPGLEYSVILWPVRDGNDDWAGVFHEAATVAEAADKCREALGS